MDTPPALLKWGWEKNPEVWERRFIRLPRSYRQSTSVMATDNCQPDSILKHQGDGPLAHGGELSWLRKWGVKTRPSHPLWEPGPHRWKQGAEAQPECIASAPWLWVQCRVPTVSGSCFFGFLTLGDCTLEPWAGTNSYFPQKFCRSTLSWQQEKEFGPAGVKMQARTMVPTASREGSDSTELWFAAHSGEGASDAVVFPLQKEGEEHPHFPSS